MLNLKQTIAALGICIVPMSLAHAASVSISNNGFESDWSGWTSSGSSAISTSDHYEGSKAAKLTGSSGTFTRVINVSANTNYSLSAYVLGKGKITAKVGSTTTSKTASTSSWTKTTLTFNSGSATSVTIGGAYNSGEGRFDKFTLDSTTTTTSSVASSTSSVASSSSSKASSSASSVVVSSSSSSKTSSAASSTSSANSNGVPADLSDVQFLTKWKITLPISFTNESNKASEVKQPSLDTYSHADYFHLGSNGTSIIFKSIAGGARTSTGTAYARSELREMAGTSGTSSAAWNCTSTTNGMNIRQKLLTTTPTDAPNATVAQIHDDSNDNLMVKYFGPATGANGTSDTGVIEARFNNDTKTVQLDSAYKLGDEMTVNVSNSSSGMRVQYKNLRTGKTGDTGNVAMSGVVGSCFYKAGLYIQTCSKIDIYGNTNTVCVDKKFDAGRYAQPLDSATLEMFSLTLTNPQ